MSDKITDGGMWNYLTDMSEFKKELPFYVDDLLSEEQVQSLNSIFDELLAREPEYYRMPGDQEEYRGKDWYDPKRVVHMSRQMLEFECPEDIEKTLDEVVKPVYPEEIKLAHYSYIDYDLRHGEGRYAPSLPPHIDNSEDIVTFNYMLDGNIDWELYINDVPYTLRKGQALVFSALNMPHFRPKRKWKEGEFVKILSFDYSPLTDFRFTGKDYALDPLKFPERVERYIESVNNHPKMQSAWTLYTELGIAEGIPEGLHAAFAD